jgi:acyl carrier protein
LIDRGKIERELIDFFSTKEALNQNGPFSGQTNLIEAGLDSMILIELLLLVEEKYGFWIPESYLTEEVFDNVKTLAGSIAALLHEKGNNS